MTLYVTSMDIPEMLEIIEEAKNQEEAIASYCTSSSSLHRFFKWYTTSDFSDVVESLDYDRGDLRARIYLVSVLSDLEYITKCKPAVKKRILEQILSKVNDKAMLFLENVLTKDIKEYYPNIDWELLSKYTQVNI